MAKRSKLSILTELVGFPNSNKKRKNSKKSSNIWLEKQSKTPEAQAMVQDMIQNDNVIQAAIISEIIGVKLDLKNVTIKPPIRMLEESMIKSILADWNTDEEMKK